CHTPMAHLTMQQAGESAPLLDGGLFDPARDLHTLAMDGVSCAVCHQIEPDNLGQPESFSGLYSINAELPAGERPAYSRFDVDDAGQRVMQAASGYVPEIGAHASSAELCATCHTLYTPYVDDTGE